MIKSSEWIRENMMGIYSKELGRPLTEAELRVQRCLKQLSVPDWYIKHSKPQKILKNYTPIECRPPVWKTIRAKGAKSPRRKSPKNSPRKSPSKATFSTGTLDSGYGTVQRSCKKPSARPWGELPSSAETSCAEEAAAAPIIANETYRITRKTPRKNASPCISISPSSSECESPSVPSTVERSPRKKQQQATPSSPATLNRSSTFPKMTPSRKIANLNIVLAKPPPPPLPVSEIPLPGSDEPILASSMNSFRKPSVVGSSRRRPHTPKTKLYCTSLEIKPKCNARPELSSSSSSDEEEEEEEELPVVPSPTTHFFNSEKKSVALERVVQSKLSDSGCSRGLIQDIISELGKSVSRHSNSELQSQLVDSACHRSFVKSMVSALEQSLYNDDSSASSGSDSDLAKSTSISFKSYDSADERPNTPPAHFSTMHACLQHERELEQQPEEQEDEDDEEEEEDVYWIPSRISQLPRTSSLLSLMSKGSARDRCSPRFSPIDDDSDSDRRSNAYKIAELKSTRLFRIDETGVLDSGYSDRSSSPSNSGPSNRYSSSSSNSSSSSPVVDSCHPALSNSGPYVLESFFV